MTHLPDPTKRAAKEREGMEQTKRMNDAEQGKTPATPPDELPNLADGQPDKERPDHPASDRA